MFRSPAADPTTDVDVGSRDPNPTELIPLSVLALDLAAPGDGWAVYLAGRGIEITLDDVGRAAIARADARQLFDERREAEAEQARKREEVERQLIEQDQLRRAQIWGGIPADMIPDGLAPAQAMMAAEHNSRPRRTSVLQDALAGGGTTFHPIRHGPDEDAP